MQTNKLVTTVDSFSVAKLHANEEMCYPHIPFFGKLVLALKNCLNSNVRIKVRHVIANNLKGITMAENTPIPETTSTHRDIIFIGKKPIMTYAMAALMQLSNGDITIKARGRAISSAVDVAEVVCRRFLGDSATKKVSIDTEILGEPARNVSTIEIKISNKKK